MKRIKITLLAMGLSVGFFGCNSPPKTDSDESVFDFMQKQVADITDDGGMAALGIADSRNVQVAIAKAKLAARKNLAQLVSLKINNLEKQFIEEVGEAKGSEMNELFSSATKQVTSQKLQGSVPKMQKFDEKDGITTAYILMVLDPKIVDAALQGGGNNAKHLYERFRASKAFKELDEEVKAYQKAEMQGL